MYSWKGASALCMHEGRLLMVLQGNAQEEKRWSVPSGGLEEDESFQECCKREVWEETGYLINVGKHVYTKWGNEGEISTIVHYYEADLIGGEATLQDPDQLIHKIDWISLHDIQNLHLAFPEDHSILKSYMKRKSINPYDSMFRKL
ncbi:NUDIX hydrolase [Rossellomorea sp. AcN35-11]|nr:NUDIX hydrolase [Rossellomorea aquimaris]WJV28633.1 NUDIX hydrolase [Rossellomorea sp. AcN35-11]